MSSPDAAVAISHCDSAGVRITLRVKQSVYAEITIMLFFAMVTAIGIAIFAVFVINCVVTKFPNTAAHHI